MTISEKETIEQEYISFISNKAFPCIAAHAAASRQHIKCFIAEHMACAFEDENILQFLYEFVDSYRNSDKLFHSAAIIFKNPVITGEDIFEPLLWQRLQALSDMDSLQYRYDKRVDADPASLTFSFSLKEEAFFIIGMHSASSRASRQFKYPTIIFNVHAEFEKLREMDKYDSMKDIVRKRDEIYSGSVNPMLDDFGRSSEALQYSGKQYNAGWQCPLIIRHGTD